MSNFTYDSYGYVEPQSFETLAQQKDLTYGKMSNVEVPIYTLSTFYTECGQKPVTLIQPDIVNINA